MQGSLVRLGQLVQLLISILYSVKCTNGWTRQRRSMRSTSSTICLAPSTNSPTHSVASPSLARLCPASQRSQCKRNNWGAGASCGGTHSCTAGEEAGVQSNYLPACMALEDDDYEHEAAVGPLSCRHSSAVPCSDFDLAHRRRP